MDARFVDADEVDDAEDDEDDDDVAILALDRLPIAAEFHHLLHAITILLLTKGEVQNMLPGVRLMDNERNLQDWKTGKVEEWRLFVSTPESLLTFGYHNHLEPVHGESRS